MRNLGHVLLGALLLAAPVAAQGSMRGPGGPSITLDLQAINPDSFSASCAPGFDACNLVLSESVTLTAGYNLDPGAPTPLQSAGFFLYIGFEAPMPFQIPMVTNDVFITVSPLFDPTPPYLDSITNPFAPRFTFAPGASSSDAVSLTIGLDDLRFIGLGAPQPGMMPSLLETGPQTLVAQVLAQDLQNPGGFVASEPARFQVITPGTGSGFEATVNFSGMGNGPAAAPGALIMITGTNFLAQSDWVSFPPRVTFELVDFNGTPTGDSVDSPNVIPVNGTTLACEVPPFPVGTAPQPCTARITYTNNPFLEPNATTTATFEDFTFTQTGLMPTIASIDVSSGGPEGGELRTIAGTFFTQELTVVITPDFGPSGDIEVPAMPGSVVAAAGVMNGTEVPILMPPLCTGSYTIRIRNCDGVMTAGSIPYTVGPLLPTIDETLSTPRVTLDPALGGQMVLRFADGGTATFAGTDLVTDTSNVTAIAPPLGAAGEVLIDYFDDGFATRVSQPFTGANTSASASFDVNVPPSPPADPVNGFFPLRGQHQARFDNPPCVAPQSGAPFYTTPASSNEVTVLIGSPNPPAVAATSSGIVSTRGGTEITITGSGFFFTDAAPVAMPPVMQDFTAVSAGLPITQLAVGDLQVPAVGFTMGGSTFFSPRVTLVDAATLRAEVPSLPAAANCAMPFTVRVFNPDGQVSTDPVSLLFAEPLTDFSDPTWFTDLRDTSAPGTPIRRLDAAAFQRFAAQTLTFDEATLTAAYGGTPPTPGGSGTVADRAPAVVFARNPRAAADMAADPYAAEVMSGLPAGSTLSYDYMFVFNTRFGNGDLSPGPLREFNFEDVDIPAVVQLGASDAAVSFPQALRDVTGGGAGTPVGSSTVFARVIVKACGFTWDASQGLSVPLVPGPEPRRNPNSDFPGSTSATVEIPEGNWPCVVQSRGDLVHGGLINVSGDSLRREEPSQSSDPDEKLDLRINRQIPPAGGGLGGRGGAFFDESFNSIPGPNLGVTPADLAGENGNRPFPWTFAPSQVIPAVVVPVGNGGDGAAPIGLGGGGGGGGGYGSLGQSGNNGTASGGVGTNPWGNLTPFAAPTDPLVSAACSGSGPFFVPDVDASIYGQASCAFTFSTEALESGLFYGGFGGGGGGGGLAIVVAAITLGGRGGNGGGALLLVSDAEIEVGETGVILAKGEGGHDGLDAFPAIGSDPILPLNPPGTGGGGTGGTIFAAALSNVRFAWSPAPGVPAPAGTPPAMPFIDATGGRGGPRLSSSSAAQIAGGDGGAGRIRFVINDQSPDLGDFETAFTQLLAPAMMPGMPPANALVVPAPSALPTLGATQYFGYPCQ